MKSYSHATLARAALAAALLAGASGVAVAPAAAKDKPPKVAPMKLSEPVRKALAAAQTAIAAGDLATAETNLNAADAVATNDEEKYYAATIRLQAAQKSGDTSKYEAPLNALIANPRTPNEDKGKFLNARAGTFFNAKKYPQALADYSAARALGYTDDNIDLAIAQSKIETGDAAGGAAQIETAIAAQKAAGKVAPEEWYRYAISRLNKSGNKELTAQWLRRWVAAYPSPQNWRDMIMIYLQGNERAMTKAQRIDVYRLMRAKGALADQRDYADYAQLALDTGLGGEAVAVIDEGRAAGKIPAGYVPANELYALAKRAVAAEGSLAGIEAKARSSATGALASQTADAYLGTGNYAKAIDLYRVALTKGVAKPEDVNLHLGIALARSGDKAGAKTSLASVTTGQGAEIASYWQFYVDQGLA